MEEKYECGIELYGTEVKSMRQGRVNLKESWAVVRNGEVWVDGMHISPTSRATSSTAIPCVPKRLLLHKSEIRQAGQLGAASGLHADRFLFTEEGRMKLELGLCQGQAAS